MSLQFIRLETPVIDRSSPDWLQKYFRGFRSAIELAPVADRFPHSPEWPEGLRSSREFDLAWYEGERFENFEAVKARLSADGISEERRTVTPHLADIIVPRVDELWERCRQGKGPALVFPSSDLSVWRDGDDELYLPCVYLNPYYRKLDAGWIVSPFYGGCGFLVTRE